MTTPAVFLPGTERAFNESINAGAAAQQIRDTSRTALIYGTLLILGAVLVVIVDMLLYASVRGIPLVDQVTGVLDNEGSQTLFRACIQVAIALIGLHPAVRDKRISRLIIAVIVILILWLLIGSAILNGAQDVPTYMDNLAPIADQVATWGTQDAATGAGASAEFRLLIGAAAAGQSTPYFTLPLIGALWLSKGTKKIASAHIGIVYERTFRKNWKGTNDSMTEARIAGDEQAQLEGDFNARLSRAYASVDEPYAEAAQKARQALASVKMSGPGDLAVLGPFIGTFGGGEVPGDVEQIRQWLDERDRAINAGLPDTIRKDFIASRLDGNDYRDAAE